jgi:hypothetical protein
MSVHLKGETCLDGVHDRRKRRLNWKQAPERKHIVSEKLNIHE